MDCSANHLAALRLSALATLAKAMKLELATIITLSISIIGMSARFGFQAYRLKRLEKDLDSLFKRERDFIEPTLHLLNDRVIKLESKIDLFSQR